MRATKAAALALALSLAGLLAACHRSKDTASGTTSPSTQLGGPLADLTADERAAFERGKVLFEKRFRPSEGLGPFYNATSCASCHSTPTTGGSSALYRNFYVLAVGNNPRTATAHPLLPSKVVPAFGTGSHASATFSLTGGRLVMQDRVAGQPVTVAQRNSPPIFGTGLFEFIPDQTILANADPNDDDGDGISGRFNTTARHGFILGRFGFKAQSNNIEVFTRAPLQNQMGVTSDPFLGGAGTVSLSSAALQASVDPNDPTTDDDGVPDPEISRDDLGDLIAFVRFLAPPRKKPFDDAATRGEVLFDSLGCVKCHVPSLDSSRGPVEAYTDLLLHDMGPVLADGLNFGFPQPQGPNPLGSNERDFRTQPLWGVSMHAPFLHDGRAETLEEAVLMHGGEAGASRNAFAALTPAEQADVISFLEHL